MIGKTLSLVVPVWNEEQTLKELINRVLKVKLPEGWQKEIVIVNDGSKDNSWQIMQELEKKHKEVKAFSNECNKGKTQTVKNGLQKTTGDVVVVQDADFEYIPDELVELLNLMIEKKLDVVYGNRFGKKNKIIYMKNYIGNRGLSFVSNLFTFPRIKKIIPDMETCYKMVRGDVFRELALQIESKSSFGLEPEITAKLSRYKINGKNLKFGIVPISYLPRTLEEGKKMHAFKDGMKALWEILKFNIK